MDFFSSPAYRVPPMRIVRLARFTTMNVPDLVPWMAGSARHSGAWRTWKPGVKSTSSEAVGRKNML